MIKTLFLLFPWQLKNNILQKVWLLLCQFLRQNSVFFSFFLFITYVHAASIFHFKSGKKRMKEYFPYYQHNDINKFHLKRAEKENQKCCHTQHRSTLQWHLGVKWGNAKVQNFNTNHYTNHMKLITKWIILNKQCREISLTKENFQGLDRIKQWGCDKTVGWRLCVNWKRTLITIYMVLK